MYSLKTGEVASLINVTKRTLQNWLDLGKITAPQKSHNGYYVWTESEIREAKEYLTRLKARTNYHLKGYLQ
jgi:DNA-binding transcriptional MerR regulator